MTDAQSTITALEVANLGGTATVFAILTFLLNQTEKRIMDRIAHLLAVHNSLSTENQQTLERIAQQLKASAKFEDKKNNRSH